MTEIPGSMIEASTIDEGNSVIDDRTSIIDEGNSVNDDRDVHHR